MPPFRLGVAVTLTNDAVSTKPSRRHQGIPLLVGKAMAGVAFISTSHRFTLSTKQI